MDPMEPWWNQIHRGINDVGGSTSSRGEKRKFRHIGGTPMNVREEKQGWVKVENINLHQELAEAKREVEILMQKYDMLLREKIMCM